MNFSSKLRFLTLLFLLSGLVFLVYLNPFSTTFWSPHQLYKYKLSFSNEVSEDIASWIEADIQAQKDSIYIKPPIQITAKDLPLGIEARAYKMLLNEGENLTVNLENHSPKNEVFFDLFFINNQDNIKHLQSGKDNEINYPIFKTGEYLLRFQSPLNKKGHFTAIINSNPTYSIFPIEGKGNKAIQSFWGAPRDGGKRKHEGIDIFAKKGTPVLAVTDGQIDRIKNGGLGGKTIWLYDEKLDQSIYYAHLDEQLVSENEYVKAGQMIGTVGNTGNARTTPPHLHFGIYLEKAIDPLYFVKIQERNLLKVKSKDKIGKEAMISATPARMYFAPDAKSKSKNILIKGLKVDVIAAAGAYYHVRTHEKEAFFVSINDIK